MPLLLGTTTVTLTVNDGKGGADSDSVLITVRDTMPPIVTPHPLMELWPPNHQYVPIPLSQCIAAITDACAGTLTLAQAQAVIVSVSCDEPEDLTGSGDGFTQDDIVIAADGVSYIVYRPLSKPIAAVDAVESSVQAVPTAFALRANWPNPFNPTSRLAYDVPQAVHVTLIVYNLLGQEVVRGVRDSGYGVRDTAMTVPDPARF